MTPRLDKLVILAPLQGWSTPLPEVPDPVFAQGMLGDGVALDPTSAVLCAPCDGTLTMVGESRHAVTLRSEIGAEILLHVGIDTVALHGDGFEVHVHAGQEVRAGERLISFDLDFLARRAKSLLTPVVLTNRDRFRVSRTNTDRLVQIGDELLELEPMSLEPMLAADDRMATTVTRAMVVSFEHGVHARPAATMAAAVKPFSAEITISRNGRKANARSPVALMSLGMQRGETIILEARGTDAAPAIEALALALLPPAASATRTMIADSSPARAAPANPPPRAVPAPAAGTLHGVIASRGLAIGAAFQLQRTIAEVREVGSGASVERTQLEHAVAVVRGELEKAAAIGNQSARSVAAAHLELLADPELMQGALMAIAADKSAGYAWRQALQSAIDAMHALGNARMAERADDLRDLQIRVVNVLAGHHAGIAGVPDQAILIAPELLPSQLLSLESAQLAGIALAGGGPTSHAAIIAAALQLPMLVAVGPAVLGIRDGQMLVLDAESGRLRTEPSMEQIELARRELLGRRNRHAADQQAAQREARTKDGTRIATRANLGSLAEAQGAMRNGAEGCGLLRTEFLFLERTAPPDEAEQLQRYQEIAAALQGQSVTVRTLDSGGDKPIPYLPLPHEDNPALGLRGVRTSLWRPELLRTQLRAILRVQPPRQCRIMLPMIIDAAEIRAVRMMLDELQGEMGRTVPMQLGVMVETPAAVVMADRISLEADFLSIGTNDLTQYALCIDRDHGQLADRLDGLHPAVLRLIAQCVSAAQTAGRGVAVCGGLASEPLAVPILIGLGIRELSMVPAVIPRMKRLIADLEVGMCEQLARSALKEPTAAGIRQLARELIPQLIEP